MIADQCLNEKQVMINQSKDGKDKEWEMFIEQTGVFDSQDILAIDQKIKKEIDIPIMNEVFIVEIPDLKIKQVVIEDGTE